MLHINNKKQKNINKYKEVFFYYMNLLLFLKLLYIYDIMILK